MGKVFESKPIKRGSKIPFRQQMYLLKLLQLSSTRMSLQLSNNNNYETVSISPNLYISKKLNNMNQAQVIKKERENWERLYHKMLKGIEMMIDV